MFKNIIPHLVSFETKLSKIFGFYFSDNFSFYQEINDQNRFHYKIVLKNDIEIPNTYDFRSGYFFKKGDYWYYERKIGIFTLKFCFDSQNKVFSFNKLYSLVPFEIGHIFPVGRHIADLINLEIFLEGFIFFQGCAFRYHSKNICIIAPGFNGKTSLTKMILDKGGKYIAEDRIVINYKENKVYPTNIRTDFFTRKINKKIKILSMGKVIEISSNINKLFIIQNSTNTKYNSIAKTFFDYLNLCSLAFSKNPVIRAYIFEENLSEILSNKINELKQLEIDYKFENVKNFNFDILIKNL